MAIKHVRYMIFPGRSPVIYERSVGDEGVRGQDTLQNALGDFLRRLYFGHKLVRAFEVRADIEKAGSSVSYVGLPADMAAFFALARFVRRLWPAHKSVDDDMSARLDALIGGAGLIIASLDEDHNLVCRLGSDPAEAAKFERLSALIAMSACDPKTVGAALGKPDGYYEMSIRYFVQQESAKAAGRAISLVATKD